MLKKLGTIVFFLLYMASVGCIADEQQTSCKNYNGSCPQAETNKNISVGIGLMHSRV